MGDLQDGVQQLISARLSRNSKAAYTNALNWFTAFRTKYAPDQIWPVPLAHLENFISFLFQKYYASSTAKTYISAISFKHKVSNVRD